MYIQGTLRMVELGCSESDCHRLQAPGEVTEAEGALERDGVFQGLIQPVLGTPQRQQIHYLGRDACAHPHAAPWPITSLWASLLKSGFSI